MFPGIWVLFVWCKSRALAYASLVRSGGPCAGRADDCVINE